MFVKFALFPYPYQFRPELTPLTIPAQFREGFFQCGLSVGEVSLVRLTCSFHLVSPLGYRFYIYFYFMSVQVFFHPAFCYSFRLPFCIDHSSVYGNNEGRPAKYIDSNCLQSMTTIHKHRKFNKGISPTTIQHKFRGSNKLVFT